MLANIIKPNTPETVEQAIKDAFAIVERCELTDDLREAAFVEAVRLLGASVVIQAPTQVGPLGLSLERRPLPLTG